MEDRYLHKFSILLLIVLSLLSAGCSEKITRAEGEEAQLRIAASGGSGADLSMASSFTLTVTGPGIIEPITAVLVYESGVLAGTVLVPAGPERVFLIEGYDESGTLIYSGRTVADVSPDSALSLTIRLQPRIPMVKLSPNYYFEPYGSYLTFRVLVYNMDPLQSIRIQIDNYSELYGTRYGFYANAVTINPMLSDFASLSWYNLESPPGTVLSISHRYAGYSIIDPNGYRELATVSFDTYRPYMGPSMLNMIFEPRVISMVGVDGDTLSGEPINGEPSRAVLFDYTTERVGFWYMNWLSNDPNEVIDSSGNGLDGTASGTSLDEGAWGNARIFDGIDDYIAVPDNSLLDFSDGFTVSYWFRAAQSANEDTASIITKMADGGPINYQILMSWMPGAVSQGKCRFIFRYGSPPYQYYSSEFDDIADNQWHNIIFSSEFGEPESAILVVDYSRIIGGAWLEGNGEAPSSLNNGELLFGKQNDTKTPYYLAGGLDNVELFGQSFGWQAINYIFFPR